MSTTAADKSGKLIIRNASFVLAAETMLAPVALKAACTSSATSGSSSTIRIERPARALLDRFIVSSNMSPLVLVWLQARKLATELVAQTPNRKINVRRLDKIFGHNLL